MQPLDRLAAWFSRHESVLVAYSGGVDSALLAVVAHRTLGARALAVLALGESLSQHDREAAETFARQQVFRLRAEPHSELLSPGYRANDTDRCYHCRTSLAQTLRAVAQAEGLATIVDGFNADDLGDYRPGKQATDEAGFAHPLLELGLGKAEIRTMARHLELPLAERPANACLASRIPFGEPVTAAKLSRIERAEAAVRALGGNGFRALGDDGFRVRAHGEVARLELPLDRLAVSLEQREALVAGIRDAGFRYVTLDLEGYRTGSLNP